jgi:hypothetical protein
MNPFARSQNEAASRVDSGSAQHAYGIDIMRGPGLLTGQSQDFDEQVLFLATLHAAGKRSCIDQPTLGDITGRGARPRLRLYEKSNGHWFLI